MRFVNHLTICFELFSDDYSRNLKHLFDVVLTNRSFGFVCRMFTSPLLSRDHWPLKEFPEDVYAYFLIHKFRSKPTQSVSNGLRIECSRIGKHS